MKLIENNCEDCGFNAGCTNNSIDIFEERLCGTCFSLIEETKESLESLARERDRRLIEKVDELLDSMEKLLNSKESQ